MADDHDGALHADQRGQPFRVGRYTLSLLTHITITDADGRETPMRGVAYHVEADGKAMLLPRPHGTRPSEYEIDIGWREAHPDDGAT